MNKRFIDTNVFVYANDSRDTEKQTVAVALVADALRSAGGVISTQVLMEYGAVAVSKLGQERAAVVRQLLLMERLEVVPVGGEIIRSALELIPAYSLSFWDAVIVAAAQQANCDTLLTEDLCDGTRYGRLRVENPFRGRS